MQADNIKMCTLKLNFETKAKTILIELNPRYNNSYILVYPYLLNKLVLYKLYLTRNTHVCMQ